MLARFLLFTALGTVGMFLAEWFFPHSVNMAEIGLLTWAVIGLVSGILMGFLIRYTVFRDTGDGRAVDMLGAFIGFSIGFPLYHVMMSAVPIVYGIVSVAIEGGLFLFFYQRAVRKRRASVGQS